MDTKVIVQPSLYKERLVRSINKHSLSMDSSLQGSGVGLAYDVTTLEYSSYSLRYNVV